jgi:hypothetical protein
MPGFLYDKNDDTNDDSVEEKSEKEESNEEESVDEKEKSEDESEDEIQEGGIPKFQKIYTAKTIILSKKNRLATYTLTNQWKGSAVGTKCKKYSVKLSNNTNLMVGHNNPKKMNISLYNHGHSGYYFYCYDGKLYSELGDQGKAYSIASYDNGTIISCSLDKKVKLKV